MRKAKIITVRLPAEVARGVRVAAKSEDVSIARYFRSLILADFMHAGKPAPFPWPEPRVTLVPLDW
jgi:hypothetical protein